MKTEIIILMSMNNSLQIQFIDTVQIEKLLGRQPNLFDFVMAENLFNEIKIKRTLLNKWSCLPSV